MLDPEVRTVDSNRPAAGTVGVHTGRVLLEDAPLTVATTGIGSIPVLAAFVGGGYVHEADSVGQHTVGQSFRPMVPRRDTHLSHMEEWPYDYHRCARPTARH